MLFISLGHSEWILSLYNAPQTWFFVSEMELNTSQHACNSVLEQFSDNKCLFEFAHKCAIRTALANSAKFGCSYSDILLIIHKLKFF